MTHRQRFQIALSHKEPDRVPFDLGGSVVSSIAVVAYRRLISALNLSPRPIRIRSLYSQIAEIDEDVLNLFHVDTRPTDIHPPHSYQLNSWEKDGYRYYTDEWQITYAMPLDGSSGYSVVKHPLAEARSVDDIENFKWPNGADPTRFEGLAEQARNIAEDQKVGVILETDIGGIYEWPCWLRGTENFLTDLAGDPAMAQAIMEKIAEFKIAFWEAALSGAGRYVDLVRESDDLAGQNGLLLSPDTYRRYMMPLHKRIFATIHKHTHAAICLHSCGSIWDLIPELIETGITVLNPVQLGIPNMDSKALKREFGRDLVFWGGSCDSQQILPYATPNEVKEKVRINIEALAPGGGYIFAPINMIQADVPLENIIALAEAVEEYGVY